MSGGKNRAMFSLCSRWQSMQYNVAHGTFSYNQLGEKTSEADAFVLFVFSFLAVLTEGLTQQGQKNSSFNQGEMPFSWSFSLQLHVTYVSWVVQYSYIRTIV